MTKDKSESTSHSIRTLDSESHWIEQDGGAYDAKVQAYNEQYPGSDYETDHKHLMDLMTLQETGDGILSGGNQDTYEELMVKLYPDEPLEPGFETTAEEIKEAALARVAQQQARHAGKCLALAETHWRETDPDNFPGYYILNHQGAEPIHVDTRSAQIYILEPPALDLIMISQNIPSEAGCPFTYAEKLIGLDGPAPFLDADGTFLPDHHQHNGYMFRNPTWAGAACSLNAAISNLDCISEQTPNNDELLAEARAIHSAVTADDGTYTKWDSATYDRLLALTQALSPSHPDIRTPAAAARTLAALLCQDAAKQVQAANRQLSPHLAGSSNHHFQTPAADQITIISRHRLTKGLQWETQATSQQKFHLLKNHQDKTLGTIRTLEKPTKNGATHQLKLSFGPAQDRLQLFEDLEEARLHAEQSAAAYLAEGKDQQSRSAPEHEQDQRKSAGNGRGYGYGRGDE